MYQWNDVVLPSPRDMFEVLHQRSTIDTSSPNGYFDVREAIQKKKEISKGQKSLIY